MELRHYVEQADGVARHVIELAGDLTHFTDQGQDELERVLAELRVFAELEGRKGVQIRIDVRALGWMDLTLVALLIRAHQQFTSLGGRLAFDVRGNESLVQLFRLIGLGGGEGDDSAGTPARRTPPDSPGPLRFQEPRPEADTDD